MNNPPPDIQINLGFLSKPELKQLHHELADIKKRFDMIHPQMEFKLKYSKHKNVIVYINERGLIYILSCLKSIPLPENPSVSEGEEPPDWFAR